MAEQNILALELSKAFVEAIKARIPLLTEVEKENLQLQKKDPKDKLTAAIHPVKEKVCFICQKSPQIELSICATCGKLGHPSCTSCYSNENYPQNDKKVFSGVAENVLTQLLIQFVPNLVFSHQIMLLLLENFYSIKNPM